LDYTAPPEDEITAAGINVDALTSEDYSRIIDELKSHRREIERLHHDFNHSSLKGQGGGACATC